MGQEALRQRLKLLTEEKSDLQSQLMDCHLRIEQEGKVQLTVEQNNKSLSPELKCLCRFAPDIYTSCFKFFLVTKKTTTFKIKIPLISNGLGKKNNWPKNLFRTLSDAR